MPWTTAKLKTDRQFVAEGSVLKDPIVPVEFFQASLADSGSFQAGVTSSDCPPALEVKGMLL